jgi:hypothetical protein
MKNKKFTYFLGISVVLVWGIIIYRVFAGAGGEEDRLPAGESKAVKEPYKDYAVPRDTLHLRLDYKDPFAVLKSGDSTVIPVKKLVTAKVQPVIPVNWGFIKYTGYIHNPGAKNLVALVSINGRSAMMTEGETIEQVRLLKNLKDSIRIDFNGKTTYIKMRPAVL